VNRVGEAVRGVWEFVAGDDWITAVGVAVALALTALIDEDASAWLVMPVAVAALLGASIWREWRKRDPG
jgi:hypothetical protein